MSSSSSTAVQGPLTTIFTPPSGCFDQVPQTWPTSLCWSGGTCYWSLPGSCYPTGASTNLTEMSGGPTVMKKLSYSPGAFPSGFYTAYPTWTTAGATVAIGCIPNFLAGIGGSFCASVISPTRVTIPGEGVVSSITAVLPQIAVSWHDYDLAVFTPASAPILPSAELAAYEASVAAQQTSTSSTGPRKTEPPSPTAGSSSGQTSSASSNGRSTGLSTGAKAGIGIGVAAAVLLLIAIVFIAMRRRKKRTGTEHSEKRPYIDSKAELDDSKRQRGAPVAELPNRGPGELAANEKPQELATD